MKKWRASVGLAPGFLAAIISAQDRSDIVDHGEVQRHNAALCKQLKEKQQYATDVIGDGNCFYKALSISMRGHQNDHAALIFMLSAKVEPMSLQIALGQQTTLY